MGQGALRPRHDCAGVRRPKRIQPARSRFFDEATQTQTERTEVIFEQKCSYENVCESFLGWRWFADYFVSWPQFVSLNRLDRSRRAHHQVARQEGGRKPGLSARRGLLLPAHLQ